MISVSVMWRRPTVHAHQIVNAKEMLLRSSGAYAQEIT